MCHSTLSDGRLPDCSKANKMGLFVKAHCSNLTSLEKEINFSTYFIYANIRELPNGGQLSMHGNVFNVPADVISTVSTLPRSIDESQTSPIN